MYVINLFMYRHNNIILVKCEIMTGYLLENLNFASMPENGTSYGIVDDGAIAVDGRKIAWCGERPQLPSRYSSWRSYDLKQRFLTPGLIDCHTHIVHGGNRVSEFEMRLQGMSYQEITEQGGGINATLEQTRRLSVSELVEQALPRIDALMAEGVCTVEIKSGYGLDAKTELDMLRAARQIGREREIVVKTSFLGAHLAPPNYRDQPEQYLEKVCIPTLQKAATEGLVDAVDGFCETVAFSDGQLEALFSHAESLGLPVKLHAEQLSHSGGCQLAARFRALSADHLEFAKEEDVIALRKSRTVAVLLPGAYYTLKQSQKPPVKILRKHGVPIAIATDCNPGSSPLNSILTAMNLSCTLFELTPQEALAGITVSAAKALGLTEVGQVKTGKTANFAVWNVSSPSELAYRIGFNHLAGRIYEGKIPSSLDQP